MNHVFPLFTIQRYLSQTFHQTQKNTALRYITIYLFVFPWLRNMTNINVIIKDTNHIKNLEMLNQTHWKWQNVNLSKVELISCQALGQEQELTNL